ncbi:MAG TPA: hypothetical protein VLG50_02250 [Candidatus Saccharimonadales bacterium]|nr:hypothetical protein [Candidatus Saccharimonadales bacterium]
MIYLSFIFYFLIVQSYSLESRNIRRPLDTSVPIITVTATDPELQKSWNIVAKNPTPEKKEYRLKSNFLQLRPIKKGFNQEFFKEAYLPSGVLVFRDKSGFVNTSILSQLANELVEEIKTGHQKFTHFDILKDRDFNYTTLSGLIVAKYKDYPFVIKLSIEHPHTMVQPFSKSFETDFIFILGGNLRHLSNFTRIENLKNIKSILRYNPAFVDSIDFPRKWYWKPNVSHDLKIIWSCNGVTDEMYLPSVYATISDFIKTDKIQPQQELNKIAMKVAIDTGFLIDPHAGNFVIEQDTGGVVLLDTENFRMMTGIDQCMKAKKYFAWYVELANNCLYKYFMRSKQERLDQCTLV